MSIVIKDMTFKYDEKLFNNFNLTIKKNSFTTIIGSSGSGKSTLVRILIGLLDFDGTIKIDNIILNKENIRNIRNKISVVFENPEYQFVAETVFDDIAFSLENKGLSKDIILKRVNNICKKIGITHILNSSPHELSGGEKQLVALANALVLKPKYLILDESLDMIDQITKTKIFQVLLTLRKEYNFTLIMITHNLEDSIYSEEIAIIDSGKLLMQDKKENVYLEEKIIKKLGLNLPFMADLCIKLKYYDLIDEMIFDMDKLVNHLWK